MTGSLGSLHAGAAAAFLLASDVVSAACPPLSYYASRGAISFTGRIVGKAPTSPLSPFAAWVDVDVTDDPSGRYGGRTVRVHTPEMAMYTASFDLGRTYRLSVLAGEGGRLSTDACMMQR